MNVKSCLLFNAFDVQLFHVYHLLANKIKMIGMLPHESRTKPIFIPHIFGIKQNDYIRFFVVQRNYTSLHLQKQA